MLKRPKNFVSVLQNRAEATPHHLAALFLEDGINETSGITYRELDIKARAVAGFLQNHHLYAKQILLAFPPGLDFIVAFIGCLYAGVVAVPISLSNLGNPEKNRELIGRIAKDAEVSGVLTTAVYMEEIEQICNKYLEARILFIADATQIEPQQASNFHFPELTGENCVYLQYTSGSSGAPKAAIIRHKNLFHSLNANAKAWHYKKNSISLTWTSHAHVFGLVCGILLPLFHGNLAIIIPTLAIIKRPLSWLEAISRYLVTHSGCPNFAYDLCIEQINDSEIRGLNLKNWKVAINGGERVRPGTLVDFAKKFSSVGFSLDHFCSAYGMSELTGTIATSRYGKRPFEFILDKEALKENKVLNAGTNMPQIRFMSSGRLLTGLKALIVDPETLSPVDDKCIGEIWLTGQALVSGYWRNAEATQQAFAASIIGINNNYFRTGDLGFIYKNELCVTGRLNEVINIYGKKYYPLDLEVSVAEALKEFVGTSKQIVFVDDTEAEDRIVFIQEIDSCSDKLDFDALSKLIRKTLTEQNGVDVDVVILVSKGSLAITQSGKLQRHTTRQNYAAGKFAVIYQNQKQLEPPIIEETIDLPSVVSTVSNSENIKQIQSKIITYDQSLIDALKQLFYVDFAKIIATALQVKPTEIAFDNAMSAYGFDSLNIVRLTNDLNRIYELTINPSILYQYATLEEFVSDVLSNNLNNLVSYYQSSLRGVNNTQKNTESDSALSPTKHEAESTHPIIDDTVSTTHFVENTRENDIAVIGMHGVFPGANDLQSYWNILLNGIDPISEIPEQRWSWQDYYGDPQTTAQKTNIKWGGFIEGMSEFDAAFFNISPREAELTDPQQRLFLQVVWKTIEDAGYSTTELAIYSTGIFVGVFNNDYAELLHKNAISDAYITTGVTHSSLANRISYLLNLHGPSEAIDTACSSSLVAIHHAIQAIHSGDCKIAIAGGVNALLSPSTYISASKAGMLSVDGRCKTFDKSANGYVRAEGAAAIVMRPLKDALQAGDHIYAVIKGSAVNHGGHVSSLTVPNPNAQAEVIVTACRRAEIAIDSLSYIETHGTGTALGDPIEINGLKKAFNILTEEQKLLHEQKKINYCGLGAVKSNIGHLESAAGMAGLLKVILAMKNKYLPANLHFQEINPYIELDQSPFYIVDKNIPWEARKDVDGRVQPLRAGVSSFGFGGSNAHIILEQAPEPNINSITQLKSVYPITFSAKTQLALQQRMRELLLWLTENKHISLASLSYTLNVGRNHFQHRCAFVVSTIDELCLNLQRWHQTGRFENSLDENDCRVQFDSIAKQYQAGKDFEWERLYDDSEKQRLSLPTYPFAKEQYWIPQTIQANKLPQEEVVVTKTCAAKNNDKRPILMSIQDDITQLVKATLKIQAEAIELNKNLSELGFDSIAFKELGLKIENLYQIQLIPTLFYAYHSIEEVSKYLMLNHVSKIIRSYQAASRNELDQEIKPINADDNNTVDKRIETAPQENEAIAVIGMQGLFPQAADTNEFWINLITGKDVISEIPDDRWNWRENYGDSYLDVKKTNSKWGGFIAEIDKFDAGFFNISAREANYMDPQQRLLMEVVWKTIENAGYDPKQLHSQKVGVFVGVEFYEYQKLISDHKELTHGFIATGNSHSILANRISYYFNFHGPSEVIDTACSSSLVAMHRAVSALRAKECDMALACGVSLIMNPETYVITSQLGVLSSDGHCKTFDKTANGYVKGEGVAAVLLKPLSSASQDRDTILGLIKGSAVNHGGKAQSLTAPNASAQAEVIVNAITQADVDPATISLIETHGTGTDLGDPIEIEGLKQAFNQLYNQQNSTPLKTAICGLGALKTNIGHLEPASGIAGVFKVLLAMQHGFIPKNLHFNEQNPYIELADSPFYFVNETQKWSHLKAVDGKKIPRRAGVSSFGFGGTNAHLVLEEYISASNDEANETQPKPYYLIVLSTKQLSGLKQKYRDLYNWLETDDSKTSLANLSYTLAVGRTHFENRCAIIVNSIPQLKQTLTLLNDNQSPSNCIINTEIKLKHSGPVIAEIYKVITDDFNHYQRLSADTYHEKLLLWSDLYCNNFAVDWSILFKDENVKRVANLPGYPFEKQRHWYDLELTHVIAAPITIKTPVISKQVLSENRDDLFITYLQTVFAEVLNIESSQIDSESTYEIYGVDSLLGLEIIKRLEREFGELPKTILYEKNNLLDLADYLQKKYPLVLNKLFATGVEVHEHAQPTNVMEKPLLSMQNNDKSFSLSVADGAIEDIAIVGLNGVFPQANDVSELWKNLTAGRDCITEVPPERWNYKDYPVQVGGETKYYQYGGFIPDIDKFDTMFFNIAPNESNLMDPQERLFMQSAWATFEDAGYSRERLRRVVNNEVGVFVGVTYNFYPLYIADEWAKGNRLPLDIQMFSVANRVSYFLNLNGPSYPIDTACSSSLAAIHQACLSLRNKECKMALAGGVNLSLHPCKYHMLGSYSFMSDQARCASFAAGGNGYVPGEGVGAVLLKPLSAALQDGDHIYAVIKASSMNHGGKTSGYTVPNPNAQAELIKHALQQGSIDPRTITYIEAHGTGTSLGDPIEIRGLQEAFETYTNDKQFCAIGSIKSNIGHLESAAGISQLAKVILQMQHKTLVASIHSETLNPFIDFEKTPFRVQRELTEWRPTPGFPLRAGISSFGAGGTNVHVIVEEYIAKTSVNTDELKVTLNLPFVLVLSAQNNDRLKEYAEKISTYLINESQNYPQADALRIWLMNVCYTLQIGREVMPARFAIVAETLDDLLHKLQSYGVNNPHPISQIWTNQEKSQQDKLVVSLQLRNQNSKQTILEEFLSNWINGKKVVWDDLYAPEKPQIISLPTYPFAKRRCWVPSIAAAPKVLFDNVNKAHEEKQITIVTTPVVPQEKSNVNHYAETLAKFDQPPPTETLAKSEQSLQNGWLYNTEWQQHPLTQTTKSASQSTGKWLIFSDKELGFHLLDVIGKSACIYCFSAEKYSKFNDSIYYINPNQAADYQQVLTDIYSITQDIRGIIYLSDFSRDYSSTSQEDLVETYAKNEKSHQLQLLFQALIQQKNPNKMQLCLVTRNSQAVSERQALNIWQHYYWSFARIFCAEQANYQLLLIDLDEHKNLRADAQLIATEIQHFDPNENHLAFRDEQRYVSRLIEVSQTIVKENSLSWSAPKAVFLTGGLGALGAEVAKFLVQQGTKNLLMVGTTQLPARADWNSQSDAAIEAKINVILSLEKFGAEINYFAIDVCNAEAMQAAVLSCEQKWKQQITGVFHLAGITTDNLPIATMSVDVLQRVLQVKALGALVLHKLFLNTKLECFVQFSSIAALPYFGMSGLSAYAVANQFLDGLAYYRRSLGLPALSIHWAAWAEIGMSVAHNHNDFLDAVGMTPIPTQLAIDQLHALLTMQMTSPIVFKIDWNKFLQVNSDARKNQFFKYFHGQYSSTANTKLDFTPEQVKQIIINAASEMLGLEIAEINPDEALRNYGMDSIVGVNFVNKLNTYFPDLISPMDLYRYVTINQLCDYIGLSIGIPAMVEPIKIVQPVTVINKDQTDFETNDELKSLTPAQLNQLLENELNQIAEYL